MDGFARSVGADYTRYADDLALSGGEDLRRRAQKATSVVAAIAREEGFRVNHRKTRIMHRSDRQILTGIVINVQTNIRRCEYDRLKAILHNCVKFGAASQNREGRKNFRTHLRGRVEHVNSLNPVRGEKLRAMLERIDFGDNVTV